MPSYREDDQMGEEIAALLPRYGPNKTDVLRAAVHALWQRHFGDNAEPWIKGWDEFVLAKDTPCADTGVIMPAGTKGWREVWSDGREGAIYSRASLVADGVLYDE